MTASLRVVIADDSESYRSALRRLLRTIPGISVVAEADNGVDTLVQVREVLPDLLILDIRMPRMNGWEVLRELQASGDGVRVLVHGGFVGEHTREQALQRGASAVVPKGDAQLLIETLLQLMHS